MKTWLKVLSCSVMLAGVSAPALADQGQTISLGYSQGKISHNGDDVYGVNLKYRYEINDEWGWLASGTYMKGSIGAHPLHQYYTKERVPRDSQYYSFMAGPTYRFSPEFSVYGKLGYANTKVTTKVTNKYKSDFSSSESKKGLGYGLGMQINYPSQNVSIDLGYEGAPSTNGDKGKTKSMNAFNVGLGYRF